MSSQLGTGQTVSANPGASAGNPVKAADESAPDKEPWDHLTAAGNIRILVVDDEVAMCRLIERALRHPDFTVETIDDPGRMEATLEQNAYDLIVLDYTIPGLSSETMFDMVQQHQPGAGVIVITGYPSLDSAIQVLRARFFDYLAKPFEITDLQQTVTHCLENKGLLRLSEDALKESVGAIIRERRKSLGMTLAELAKKTDVSVGYLSQIELGKNSASIETLYRISLALRLRLSDLFQTVQPRSQ